MNNYVISEIESAQKKMSGYIALLNFRFMNLCVKAEVASLLPVTVYIDGQECNIEEVANVNMPNEYQLGVYPKDPERLPDIIAAIYEAHPEFKMEKKTIGDSDDEASMIALYTMPEVNKDRYDLLMNAVKGLHEECKTRLDKIYGDYQARFAKMLVDAPSQDVEEAKKALDELNDKCRDMERDLLIKKEDEIEEAYQKYLREEEEKKNAEPDYDISKGFKIYDV